MLCQNCGRRSPDTKSFCTHCGAVASPDMPVVAPPRTGRPRDYRQLDARQRASSSSGPAPRVSSSGSSGLPAIVFFVVTATALSWLMSRDSRDLLSQLKDFLGTSEPAQSAPSSRPNRTPADRPAVTPPQASPASSGPRATEAAPPPTADAPTAAGQRRGNPPPNVEGLSPDEVRDRLGAPMRIAAGGDGVSVWVYQNGALLVYFYKDRASLKPPR